MTNFKHLTEEDFQKAAGLLRCDVAAIKAVVAVESPKGAFIADGKATLLFEAHVFSKYTRRKYDSACPDISSPRWNKNLYKGGILEWRRFERAAELDPQAAMLSVSMGAFQIMGFNHALAGFKSVKDFFDAMNSSEYAQLQAFVELIEGMRLDDELREHRWADFARLYNGPRYAENKYDQKLAVEYARAAGDGAIVLRAAAIPVPAADTPPDLITLTPALALASHLQEQGSPALVVAPLPPAPPEPQPHVSDSSKSVKAGISAATVVTVLTTVGQWLKANSTPIVVACICVTLLAMVFMFRQALLAYVREKAKLQW